MFFQELLRGFLWVVMAGGFLSIASVVWPWFDINHQSNTIGGWLGTQKYIFVRIYPPAHNTKSIGEMHAFFKSLTASYLPKDPVDYYVWGSWHDKYVFEIHGNRGDIGIFMQINSTRLDLLKNIFDARFPGTRVVEVEDPLADFPRKWDFTVGRKARMKQHLDYTAFIAAEFGLLGGEKIVGDGKLQTEGNDIFPLKSYIDFQRDENNPIADPITQLFATLQSHKDAYTVVQFVLTPFSTNNAEEMIKDKWREEMKMIKKKFMEDSVVPSLSASDDGDESEDSGRAMLMTDTERKIIDSVSRKIGDQIWKGWIKMGMWTIEGKNPKNMFQEVFTYFEEFSTDLVRLLPRPGARTWDDDKGRDMGVLGPWVGVVKNEIHWEKQRIEQSQVLYDKFINRSSDSVSPGQYFSAETLASMFHFPVTINDDPAQAQMAKMISGENEEGAEIGTSTSAPANLPM